MDSVNMLAELRTVFSSVDTYISTNQYMLEVPSIDTLNDQFVLNRCYEIALNELQQIGIVLNVSLEEFLESYYDANCIIHLKEILDIDNLSSIFTSNSDFSHMLIMILTDSETHESNYFSEFLDLYERYYSSDTKLKHLLDNSYFFSSTMSFRRYIVNVKTNAITRCTLDSLSSDKLTAFFQLIQKDRSNYKIAVEHVLSNSKLDLNEEYLLDTINKYDIEKIQPTNSGDFYFAIMSNPEDLNESLKSKQKDILYKHHINVTHHIEYYLIRDIIPTNDNLVELISHFYGVDNTLEEFKKEVHSLITTKKKQDVPFFSTENIQIIITIARCIEQLYLNKG